MMFKRAALRMREVGARFLVTGEVLGQRPMSQMPKKLQLIEQESGLEGLILRPLSAKHLPETIAEREGWVDRNKLLAIQGRRRREQMDLAESLEIGDYPCPSGGCLLTDKNFARLVKDAIAHDEFDMKIIARLKTGRHFRLDGETRLIIGRDQKENERLALLAGKDIILVPKSHMGPTGILAGADAEKHLDMAMSILGGYADGDGIVSVHAEGRGLDLERSVQRLGREEAKKYSI